MDGNQNTNLAPQEAEATVPAAEQRRDSFDLEQFKKYFRPKTIAEMGKDNEQIALEAKNKTERRSFPKYIKFRSAEALVRIELLQKEKDEDLEKIRKGVL